MKASNVLAGLLCISLTMACGDRGRGDETSGVVTTTDKPRGELTGDREMMTVTGCLTEAGGRFVLTQLEQAPDGQRRRTAGTESAAGGPTTETYELIDLEDELRAHVGKQVTVYGQADETRVAELRGLDPPAGATGTAGRQSGRPRAQVDTESRTRVEMRRLRILSVTPAGGLCAA